MKKLISAALIALSLSNVAFADCDYSKIVSNPDGTYTYSKELHICVGKMKQDLDIANTQIVDYKKAIELKDLALVKADQRTQLWMDTTYKLEDRVNTIDSLRSKNEVLYFGLGVVLTGIAVWGAGQLAHR